MTDRTHCTGIYTSSIIHRTNNSSRSQLGIKEKMCSIFLEIPIQYTKGQKQYSEVTKHK
jgi:hypothetical protein